LAKSNLKSQRPRSKANFQKSMATSPPTSMANQATLLFLILSTAGINTAAQALLKLGAGQSLINPFLISGVIAYGASTLFYISVLGKLNLSFVYPVIIGLTMISATFVGKYLFRERIDFSQWIGISLVLGGVLIIASSRK
jgi:small multidrug resistance pump